MALRDVRLNLRLSQDEWDALMRLARETDRTPSRLVAALVREASQNYVQGSQQVPSRFPEGTQREPKSDYVQGSQKEPSGNPEGTQKVPSGNPEGTFLDNLQGSCVVNQETTREKKPKIPAKPKRQQSPEEIETQAWATRMIKLAVPFVGNEHASRQALKNIPAEEREEFQRALESRNAQPDMCEFNPLHKMAQAGNWRRFLKVAPAAVPVPPTEHRPPTMAEAIAKYRNYGR